MVNVVKEPARPGVDEWYVTMYMQRLCVLPGGSDQLAHLAKSKVVLNAVKACVGFK